MGFLYLYRFSKRGRRSPLTRQLLRSPGESLRTQIEDLSINIDSYVVIVVSAPLLLFSTYLAQTYPSSYKLNFPLMIIYIFATAIFVALVMLKLWKLLKVRNTLRLGLDCEMAVGQELNHLMLEGCKVYHDFPAEKFNIDHVVVSPKGVFAVETKGRAKPDKKGGSAEAAVVYDGQALQFPGWRELEPLDQSKRQAVWLAKWLSSAVGEPLSVHPVLALPGWFVDLKKPADLFIFNGKNPASLLKWKNDSLSEVLIKRIIHQVDQRCRDVEPIAYSQSKKK